MISSPAAAPRTPRSVGTDWEGRLAKKAFVQLAWAEREALRIRQHLSLDPLIPLDPYLLAEVMQVKLCSIFEVQGFALRYLVQLVCQDARGWSAGTICLPTGEHIVVMNPTHSPVRKRATLMEELAHIHLHHQPSYIAKQHNGICSPFRSYDDQQEQEAYWVGAAALVPLDLLRDAQSKQTEIRRLAGYCKVSPQLITFRANINRIHLPF